MSKEQKIRMLEQQNKDLEKQQSRQQAAIRDLKNTTVTD